MAFTFISEQLSQQKKQTRYRQRICTNNCGDNLNHIIIEDKSYINFSSNDYLGLNNHPIINSAMQEGVDRFGLCASASSLVTGYQYAHQSLEETICQWLNKPSCLLFSSGFSANLALFHALGSTQAKSSNKVAFFLDKLSHASMIDGAYQSQGAIKRFAHNDMTQLARFLAQAPEDTNKLIASEGVFSMDGDKADINKLKELAENYDSWLYLDDAHSIGVIGDKGQGSNYFSNVDISMATFGKALATSGAFIACEQELKEYLTNFSRHYIYSTAISPAVAWATKKSIELTQSEQWRRDKIVELSELFLSKLDKHINVLPSDSSIHAIIIGDEQKAIDVSKILKNQGLWVTAIRPPTVANGTSRLRVTICANHSINDINKLASTLNKALNY